MPFLTLKRVLLADAVTCALVFVIGVFDAYLIAPIVGLPEGVIQIAGWICLPVALLLGFLALQAQPSRGLVQFVALGNLGWVAASFAVLATFAATLTSIGAAIVAAQAIGVLVFALLEIRGARTVATA